jgi:tryptophanyl-tRNA synthetase
MSLPSRKIVLSGLRPTGRVHLGNYWGAVKNWVDLQAGYDCRYFVADLHALTTDYADTSTIRESTLEAVTDWLSVGLDPERSVIFVQSRVPQTAELALVFGMITPIGWLERVPTYKEQIEQLRERDHCVPVGKDQESHLEICREIVRRFNGFYGDVFPEPQALFTAMPKVPGLDGRKMSKSYDNTIALSDSAADVEKKVMSMVTDPGRARRTDPGNPDVCNLYPFHVLYSPPEEQTQVDSECRTAARGCVDCKKHLIRNMNAAMEPVRQKRAEIVSRPGYVKDVLEAGNAKARIIASETMERVSDAMGLL